ncbi:MAG: 1 4-alpha-glucan branching enzyme, partial [Halothiobacillaceae bacterium]
MATVTTDSAEFAKIVEARHHDPFTVLGRHAVDGQEVIRAYEIKIADTPMTLTRHPNSDLFEWRGAPGATATYYQLQWRINERLYRAYDPYCFPPQLSDYDLHLFNEGKHWHAYRILGAHPHTINEISGVLFATWAPNAERVSVVGDFNQWDGRRHAMRIRGGTGVWELFIPDLEPGTLYKFEIRNRHSGAVFTKSDPYAQQFEHRPKTASIV